MAARRLASFLATTGLVAGMLVVGAHPAGAQAPTEYTVLAGNFIGDERDELLWYMPGTGPEYMVGLRLDSTGAHQELLGQVTVNGSYRPLVGDFDGDALDEILWYAPGVAADHLWHFTSPSTVQTQALTINGSYSRPVSGDFTSDGVDDVFWYAPGSAPDDLWDFNAGGGYTSVARPANGTYIPVAGSFGGDATDDILWYAPGTAADFGWDFRPGSTAYDPVGYTINATGYRPVSLDRWGDGPGSEDIFWYAPGSAPDYMWNFVGGSYSVTSESVLGDYLTATGDFFGDGAEDVVFETYDRTSVWNHTAGGSRVSYTWAVG